MINIRCKGWEIISLLTEAFYQTVSGLCKHQILQSKFMRNVKARDRKQPFWAFGYRENVWRIDKRKLSKIKLLTLKLKIVSGLSVCVIRVNS